MSRRIYLDFNASTPVASEAVEAMRPFLTGHYGNPSSLHWAGMPAKDAVEEARGKVAGMESLAIQPMTTTHHGLTPEERRKRGITDSMIRFSIGMEAAKDLTEDLANALESV